MSYNTVLHFWFEEIPPQHWWQKDPEFDDLIERRFGPTLEAARAGELFQWRTCAAGRLAEIIVLDQFSRNIFRDRPEAFAQDTLSLVLAQEAVAADALAALSIAQQPFLLMPYMHSESALIHTQAERLFRRPGLENNYEFELRHKAIIDRFGRYPHRNIILGRDSTEQELAFLQEPGSSF